MVHNKETQQSHVIVLRELELQPPVIGNFAPASLFGAKRFFHNSDVLITILTSRPHRDVQCCRRHISP